MTVAEIVWSCFGFYLVGYVLATRVMFLTMRKRWIDGQTNRYDPVGSFNHHVVRSDHIAGSVIMGVIWPITLFIINGIIPLSKYWFAEAGRFGQSNYEKEINRKAREQALEARGGLLQDRINELEKELHLS